MRAPIKLAVAALTLGLVGCAAGAKSDASKEEFKRDLQLASSTNLDVATPAVNPDLLTLENAQGGDPKESKKLTPAPSADRAVHSEAPTVEATPEPEPAAVEEAAPVVQAPAPAPVPEPTNEPVAVAPRPQPVPAMPAGDAGAGDYGRSGGVIFGGSVIRGGGVDGDHCDIRTRGRAPVIFRSPVYSPRGIGSVGAPTIVVHRATSGGGR